MAAVISGMYASINSSKVYCKLTDDSQLVFNYGVLIVAKCIVNLDKIYGISFDLNVLIVAKCIVNINKGF